MTRVSTPAHGKKGENILLPLLLRGISQTREIGNQPHEPEDDRNEEIGIDGKDVPHQWAAEILPDPHSIRIWDEPEIDPGTACVQGWKHRRTSHREECHRFGKAVNRVAPR